MVSLRGDQAAGLRRLFSRPQLRIVTFAAGSIGVGKSVSVANLAAALARQGREVLVVDENTDDSVAAYYGALARHDLQQVVNREKSLSEVILAVAPGVRVLPAAKVVKQLASLSAAEQRILLDSLAQIGRPADVVLVDSSLDHPLGFSPLGLAAQETVIVVSPTGASITDAYALIKKVSLGYARKNFRILVNKARTASDAQAVHENIAEVAHSRRLARLDYAGHVPLDEYLRQASRLCQPVAGLFPDSPSARAYQTVAADLLNWPRADADVGGLEHFVQQLLHLSQRIDPTAIYA
ncbi:AAA family ATPase [Accumulibacter sp.]|uniref:MinD/ParA family ATP-binding protein n=1 Tax=Accumulibacter sp. TaxID=2053492 RepID=UPI001D328F97|nr:AAA family ATPase [Accumulibacter sp.]MCB1965605.1 AAA family ATPase [Accumulibacter sp.]MCP5228372.1 AAA family ATPase [Accumulibacter sp.]